MKLDFCVSHNYIQRDLLLRRRRHLPPPYIHVYTLFFRIEKNHPGIVLFLLETMQVGIKIYHFIHLVPPQ
jgi:hypothetical protein